MLHGRIGVALGSGGSRGFAHVGVLRGLLEAGITPEVVCGSSAGAVIGAAYACDRLDPFEEWGRGLDRRQVMGLLDLSFRGGALRGRRMVERVNRMLPDTRVESLPLPYAAVATDLESGREIWIRDGALVDAIHASCAVPGVVSPILRDGRWIVDGGIVNPVPVSLCRALGADSVIAVDLNAALLARRFRGEVDTPPEAPAPSAEAEADAPPLDHDTQTTPGSAQQIWADLRSRFASSESRAPERATDGRTSPGLYDVLDNTLQIMQVRITRSRMAGDPPELLVTPRLPDFALFDLHRANEAIDEGRRAVARALTTLASSEDSDPASM